MDRIDPHAELQKVRERTLLMLDERDLRQAQQLLAVATTPMARHSYAESIIKLERRIEARKEEL